MHVLCLWIAQIYRGNVVDMKLFKVQVSVSELNKLFAAAVYLEYTYLNFGFFIGQVTLQRRNMILLVYR